ncbi:hypothetical protein [Microcoleus sp. CAWBG58]|nr:hypothetical protein [Microcoleus sp. CAWBG58]
MSGQLPSQKQFVVRTSVRSILQFVVRTSVRSILHFAVCSADYELI